MHKSSVFLSLVLVLGSWQVARGDLTIDTRPPGPDFFPFGETNTATYGQTFTVQAGNTLMNSFTFLVNDNLNPDFVDFEAFVAPWDGTKAGALLFESAMISSAVTFPVRI